MQQHATQRLWASCAHVLRGESAHRLHLSHCAPDNQPESCEPHAVQVLVVALYPWPGLPIKSYRAVC